MQSIRIDNVTQSVDTSADAEVDNFWTQPPVEKLATNSDKSPQLAVVQVPDDEVADVEEFSFSFWFRHSYLDPAPSNIALKRSSFTPLAGVTEKESYESWPPTRGSKALGLWLKPETDGMKLHTATYGIDQNNDNIVQDADFPVANDYDSVWNFVYFGYSYTQKKAYFYVKFGSGFVRTLEFLDVKHVKPITKIQFQLGTPASDNTQGFNGRYFDTRFRWDNLAFKSGLPNLDWYLLNSVQIPTNFNPNNQYPITLNGIVYRETNEAPLNFIVPESNGARAYAIWGWAIWVQPANMQTWHILYRVTVQESPITNIDMGSRTLCVWYNTVSQYLHVRTYNFGTPTGDDVNAAGIDDIYNPPVNQWFFIYQGYSLDVKKQVFFVKWANSEKQNVVANLNQCVPRQLTVLLGKDDFHAGWAGQLKGWKFGVGQSNFKDSGFDDLVNAPITRVEDSSKDPETDNFWTQNPVEISAANADRSPALKETQVPDAELLLVTEYSYSFWFKYSYLDPKATNVALKRTSYTPLAGVTENTSYESWPPAMGDRALGAWLKPESSGKTIHAMTYCLNRNDPKYWQDINFPSDNDYDSVWNFVYFGYSYTLQQAFMYVKFGSGQIRTLSFLDVYHTVPVTKLLFQLGTPARDSTQGFNGRYFDVRFRWDNLAFKSSEANVNNYLQTSVKVPVSLNPIDTYILTKNTIVLRIPADQALTSIYPETNGARAYAIWGWAKWVQPANTDIWHILYRVTVQESPITNIDMGSRTLCVWYNTVSQYLHVRTYNFGTPTGDDVNAAGIDDIYNPPVNQWFFIYQGYSLDVKKQVFFVKWANSEKQNVVANLNQCVPKQLTVLLGKDDFHAGWSGLLKGWKFGVGQSNFKDSGFENLYNQPNVTRPLDTSSDAEVDNFNAPDEKEIQSTNPSKSDGLKEVTVPQADLAAITEYSFSFWFKHSYADPAPSNIQVKRTSFTPIGGVTDGSTWTYEPTCALGLYLTPETSGKNLQGQAFDADSGGPIKKNLPFPNANDYDSVWNFAYFGYSYTLQKVFLYVKFGSGQIRTLQWVDTIKPRLNGLKFQLGTPPTDSSQGMNGKYYDVRFRWDNLAFKGSEANLDWYLQTSVKVPVTLNPVDEYRLQKNGEVKRNQDDKGETFIYPELNGARAYAIWGWAKWVQPANMQTWHILYRVTVQESPITNIDMGSRTLCVWYNTVSQYLHVRTYNFGTPTGDDVNAAGIDDIYNPPVDQWFFVYQGYSLDVKKQVFFVKWANSEKQNVVANLNQYVPRQLTVLLGKDDFHGGWAGQLKGWKFGAGQPKFIESGFDQLYNAPIVNDLDDGNNEFYDSHRYNPEDQGRSGVNQEPVQILNVPALEALKAKKITAWTWFKWQYMVPSNFGDPAAARGNCYNMITITVEQNAKRLNAALCFDANGLPNVQIQDSVSNEKKNIPITNDLDLDSWNFVYLNHNDDTQVSTGIVQFGRTNEANIVSLSRAPKNWNLPQDGPIKILISGQSLTENGLINYPFNGQFFDAQISTDPYLSADTVAQLASVLSKITVDPKLLEEDTEGIAQVTEATLDLSNLITTDAANPDDIRVPAKALGSQDGSLSENVFGWYRWTGPRSIAQQPNDLTIIYRYAQKSNDELTDNQLPGDRKFALYVNKKGELNIHTYDFRDSVFTSKVGVKQVNLDDLRKWFFVYHAYNKLLQQVDFFLELSDGTKIEYTENNVRQLESAVNNLYLGKDKFDDYSIWNGEVFEFRATMKVPSNVGTPAEVAQMFQNSIQRPVNTPAPPSVHGDPTRPTVHGDPTRPTDDGQYIEPAGTCVILYTECNFQGKASSFCERHPDTDIVVKSIYVPENITVTLFEDEQFNGKSQSFTKSQECLTEGVQFKMNFMQTSDAIIKKNSLKSSFHLKKNRKL